MMKTLLLMSALFLSTLLNAPLVLAAPEAYSQSHFESLQKENKAILIEVHAPWCPTCRAQSPIVDALITQAPYQAITVLRVDFDKQKDALKYFKVSRQSTLIIFKGLNEIDRSIGDTSAAGIEKLLQKAL